MQRSTRARRRRLLSAAVLLAGLAVALPGQARPGHGHHRWGGPGGGWIKEHAEKLGLDQATLAEIDRILEASREEAEGIYEEHRAAHRAMRELLDQDEPDVDAVMRQAEVIGEVDVRKHKHRIATMLKIRSQLTPEQRSQLRTLKDEMGDRHGKHHGHRGCGDDAASESAEPPAQAM